MMHRLRTGMHLVALVVATLLPVRALAQKTDEPTGKSVQLVIGFGVGGGYDVWGRVVGRHLGRHLPGNPNVTVQNMPGAGSFAAANYIYNIAPKDGTVIGLIARDAPLGPLIGVDGARFDPRRMSWIGTPAREASICVAIATSPVKTVEDLRNHQLIIGDAGAGDGTYIYPRALADLLGLKFKFVSGFPASSDVLLAIERGEVEAICESLDSVRSRRPEWISTKRINILLQGGLEPHEDLQGVPFALDLAKSDDIRQALRLLYAGQGIGRPFIAPPDMPPEKLAMLRKAFSDTMVDPEFIADAKKQKLTLDPESGEHLESLIRQIYTTPRPVVERVGRLLK